jgi:excisionase family DNA binding protein
VSPGKDSPTGLRLPKSEVMTLQQVADYLNCHYITALKLVSRGQLPGFRLGASNGGDWRFLRSAIDNWIAQREKQPYTINLADRRGRYKRKPRRPFHAPKHR